jgi:hypothetical protein
MPNPIEVIVGALDLVSALVAIVKYWRISLGFLSAVLVVFVINFTDLSLAIRWVVGIHACIAIIILAVVWEQKCGKLKD